MLACFVEAQLPPFEGLLRLLVSAFAKNCSAHDIPMIRLGSVKIPCIDIGMPLSVQSLTVF